MYCVRLCPHFTDRPHRVRPHLYLVSPKSGTIDVISQETYAKNPKTGIFEPTSHCLLLTHTRDP